MQRKYRGRSRTNRNRVDREKRTKSLNRGYQTRRKRRIIILIIIILLLLLVGGVVGGYLWWSQNQEEPELVSEGSLDIQLQSEVQDALLQQSYQDLMDQEAVEDETFREDQIQAYVDGMSLVQKVGSVFMVTADDLADIQIAIQAGEQTKQRIQQYPVGAVHYTDHNFQNTDQMKLMLNNTTIYSNIPLLFAADMVMKTRVENTGSTLEEIGFKIDASGEDWKLVQGGTSVALDTVMNLAFYDGAKSAAELMKDGADMIYIDGAFEAVYQELLSDVQNEVISEEELTEHVQKIMELRM